jgi:AraC family transcriptional regulator
MKNPRPLLGSQGAVPIVGAQSWAGPSLQRMRIPTTAECGPQCTQVPTLFASRSGAGRRWYRSGLHEHSLVTGPQIDTYSARYERDHARWQGSTGETASVRLPPRVTMRFLQDEAEHFDLQTRYEVDDAKLQRLVHDLADEVQAGLPNGVLYADGLTLALYGWLLRHYAGVPTARLRTPTLSPAQMRRVRELIEAHIGEPLSVEMLAGVAGLSPYHFARLFKTSFGTTPHQYVLQLRAELAMQLLKSERERPIADIAAALGFASQSHLTHLLLSRTGLTPARWRAA